MRREWQPRVHWKEETGTIPNVSNWMLMVRDGRKTYMAAKVWSNGTWHTFDRNGVGGENWSEPTVKQARVEAAALAIAQGFI